MAEQDSSPPSRSKELDQERRLQAMEDRIARLEASLSQMERWVSEVYWAIQYNVQGRPPAENKPEAAIGPVSAMEPGPAGSAVGDALAGESRAGAELPQRELPFERPMETVKATRERLRPKSGEAGTEAETPAASTGGLPGLAGPPSSEAALALGTGKQPGVWGEREVGPDVRRGIEPRAVKEPVPGEGFGLEREFEPEGREKEESVPWEVRLATTWLPRVGGVLLIAGVAFGAALIQPHLTPASRVGLGYLLAAAVGVAGFFVRRRHELVGRVTIAIGLAVGYSVSFGAHYILPMRIVPAVPSLLAMAVFAAALVVLAERWKSESTAAMGFALGVIAALVSAPTSQAFALVALAVLAVAAGVLLVRNEWLMLTGLAAAGTYLSTLALWFIAPLNGSKPLILTHLGALVLYHGVFTAAFWRWGRAALARERAAAEARAHEAIPAFEPEPLPYSAEFSILNSLCLIGLSLYLFWTTETLWAQAYWVMFGVAAAEGGRLLVRRLSRAPLDSFHALTAFALVCGGIVNVATGKAESVLLAGFALAVAVGATRAKVLRFLRPLTAVCAFLAMVYFDLAGVTTTAALAMVLIPGVLLLTSALPWECIWTQYPRHFAPDSKPLRVLDALSNHFRGVVGTGLVVVALGDHFGAGGAITASMAIVALVVTAGIVLLRAWPWMLGGVLATWMAMAMWIALPDPTAAQRILAFAGIALGITLWQEAGRKARSRPGRFVMVTVFVSFAVSVMLVGIDWVLPLTKIRGLLLALFALGCWGVGWLDFRLAPLPALVPAPKGADESDDAIKEKPGGDSAGDVGGHLGLFAAAAAGGAAIWHATLIDPRESLISPVVIAAGLMAAWWVRLWRKKGDTAAGSAAIAVGAGVVYWALLVFGDLQAWSILAASGVGLAVLYTGVRGRSLAAAWTGLVCVGVGGGLGPVPALRTNGGVVGGEADSAAVLGLLLAALLLGTTRLIPKVREVFGERFTRGPLGDDTDRGASIWLSGTAAATALFHLGMGSLLPESLITTSWGMVGGVLLAMGFVFRDKPQRYISFLVFGCAIGRIFVHDLAGASLTTRAVAFLGVGILLVGAGVAYGFLRKRVE